jgi:hypothetical protein
MFNIATDYERLGKLREAAVWYQRYVDAAQDSPDRDKVIRTLRDLAAKPGTLTVRSTPNGARVLVDNSFAGVTPYSGHIKGGAHRVTIEYEGQREQREVKVEFGEPAILDVKLRGASGTLQVTGEPRGALVTVDGLPAGSLPLTLDRARPHRARHAVRLCAVRDTTAAISEPETVVTAAARVRHARHRSDGVKVGYLLGAGGGVDARGTAGCSDRARVRGGRYDASARIGRPSGSPPSTASGGRSQSGSRRSSASVLVRRRWRIGHRLDSRDRGRVHAHGWSALRRRARRALHLVADRGVGTSLLRGSRCFGAHRGPDEREWAYRARHDFAAAHVQVIRNRTAIVALLTGLNFLNYVDRFIVAAVLPRIKDELDLTNSEAGLLATIFLLGYFVTAPIFGSLGDRMYAKALIASAS